MASRGTNLYENLTFYCKCIFNCKHVLKDILRMCNNFVPFLVPSFQGFVRKLKVRGAIDILFSQMCLLY